MSRPGRFCRVTVFVLRRSDKTRRGITVRYRRLGSFRMAERGKYGHRERMAAAAWVRCEGVHRRETLAQLEAPEELVRYQTDVRAIAAEIKPGPSDFLEDAYVYDNGVESWLILISDDETELYSQFGSRVRDVPRGGRVERSGASEAFPWSLWFPKEN